MMKLLILFLCIVAFPLTISSQVKLTDDKVKEVIDNMESNSVKIIKVKVLKKWKAFNLSKEMKPQMDYNVILVKYKINGIIKAAIIDRHLVPINYDFKRKNDQEMLSYSY